MDKKFNVTFNELTEERQRLEFNSNSGKYSEELLELGAKSQYESIRLIVASYNLTSSNLLNEMLKIETSTDVIKAIWINPNFEKSRENLQILSKSSNREIRFVVECYEETPSDILDSMLRIKHENNEYDNSVAIWYNPHFIKTDDNLQILSVSYDWEIRLLVAQYEETPSYILYTMLRMEEDEDVIEAIWNNTNFNKTDVVLEEFSKAISWKTRLLVAEYEKTSSVILDTMLKIETDEDVIEAIRNNPNFKKNLKNSLILIKKKLL